MGCCVAGLKRDGQVFRCACERPSALAIEFVCLLVATICEPQPSPRSSSYATAFVGKTKLGKAYTMRCFAAIVMSLAVSASAAEPREDLKPLGVLKLPCVV